MRSIPQIALVLTTTAALGSAQGMEVISDPRFLAPAGIMLNDVELGLHDVDGDGDLDALAGGFTSALSPRPQLMWNDGGGRFTVQLLPPPDGMPFSFAVGDCDADGDKDIVVAYGLPSTTRSGVLLFRNDGSGGFALDAAAIPVDADGVYRVRLFDADGDGDLDLFKAKVTPPLSSNPQNELLLNDGTGSFVDVTGTHLPVDADNTAGVHVADYDSDGDFDLFLANGQPMTVLQSQSEANKLYWNDGLGHFTARAIPGDPPQPSNDIVVGDLDGDGDLDAIVTHGYGIPLAPTVYQNDGRGGFSVKPNACALPAVALMDAHLADFDEDGDLDLLGASHWVPRGMMHYLNRGDGTFVYLGWVQAPPELRSPLWVVADLDGDRDTDFLAPYYKSVYPRSWKGLATFFSTRRQVFRPGSPPARIGQTYSFEVWADSGHFMVPAVGTSLRRSPLGALGVLWLDPAAMLALPAVRMPASRRATVSFPIPNNPWLVGRSIAVQAVDVPPGRSAQLTGFYVDEIAR